ncbi:MAG: ECF RNA polymerase sigma factor SigH [bacterium ADurb.Bin429]|nr:MAG: ECF RNA polymerase sigma factor SigH [bacterium ADurb.Bin429]
MDQTAGAGATGGFQRVADAHNGKRLRRLAPSRALAGIAGGGGGGDARSAGAGAAVLLAREQSRRLRAALLSLGPENRLALLLHLWEGCSYADIARLLDIPLTTVEGRIHSAKAQLRRLLADNPELIGEPRKRWKVKEEE